MRDQYIALLAFLVLGVSAWTGTSQITSSAVDIQRPVYHFMPAQWWQNDPNGPMYFNGYYHLFYQYTPNSAASGIKYWGHAVSKDMVYWERLPVAISPTPGTYDENGIWSGSATIVNGEPVMLYTGIPGGPFSEDQCLVRPANVSDPKLIEWVKAKNNPIIVDPTKNGDLSGFRDPTTMWQTGKTWNLLVGSGVPGKLGQIFLYQTEDLITFKYIHVFYSALVPLVSDMFECPDFYPLDGAYVVKVSTLGRDLWTVGKYDQSNNTFVASTLEGFYDYGNFYASKSFLDTPKNRRIVFGWITEAQQQSENDKLGWSGVQTLPRETTLDKNLVLKQLPIDEVSKLRGQQVSYPQLTIQAGKEVKLNVSNGMELEIMMSVVANPKTRFGINLRSTPDMKESTQIIYEPATGPFVDVDMPGNDYRGFIINNADPNLCLQACDFDGQCYAWVYSPKGDQNPNYPMCFLKRGYPNQNAKKGTVCGRKAAFNVVRTNSSMNANTDHGTYVGPLSDPLTNLRIFIDHSVIEIYANDGRTNLVARVYPTRADSVGVSVFAVEGPVTTNISLWPMKSIW